MKKIALEGIVGFDSLARDIRAELEAAGDEDVELLVNSPGGSVTEGIAIYNAIRDHVRGGGKVDAHVVGMAASMATYIPLAASTVTVEDNSVWMIHNPFSIALGDYREMKKTADVLDGLASTLAAGYERKTKKDRAEIRAMMDEETYLFGEEIEEMGFADAIVPAGDGPEEREQALALARASVAGMQEKLKEAEADDTEQVAAMLQFEMSETRSVATRKETAENTAGIKEQGETMNLETLKNEHPDVFAEVVKVGVAQERERVLALEDQKGYDPENVKLAQVVDAAIRDGKALTEVQTGINVAIRDGKSYEGENAPGVGTMQSEGSDALTDEEQALCEAMGIDEEDFRKYNKEAK